MVGSCVRRIHISDRTSQVLACGLNTYHQLGILPVPVSANQPKAVDVELWNGKVQGVAASTFHSVIWTDSVIYTCGLHAGQLGHPNSPSKTFQSFKKVGAIISKEFACLKSTFPNLDFCYSRFQVYISIRPVLRALPLVTALLLLLPTLTIFFYSANTTVRKLTSGI